MRIAHISDLHFTSFFKNNNLDQIRHILKYAIKENTDHIIITGDLTDNADRNDFLILRKLFEEMNLLHYEKLSLVIGNHDIFGGVQTAEDIFTFPEKCKGVDYKKKIKEFYIYFKETFDGADVLDNDDIFPYAKIINGVLLIGLNTNDEYSATKNVFASNGAVNIEQFNKTIGILNQLSGKVHTKIIMLHHHFNKIKINKNSTFRSLWQNIETQTMKLRKKKRLLSAFVENGIDLVLHGHFHENHQYNRKGIRFLNGGASFKNENSKNLNINFIDIKKGSVKIRTETLKPLPAEYIPDYYERHKELLLEEGISLESLPKN